jgi:hypothetical protein
MLKGEEVHVSYPHCIQRTRQHDVRTIPLVKKYQIVTTVRSWKCFKTISIVYIMISQASKRDRFMTKSYLLNTNGWITDFRIFGM